MKKETKQRKELKKEVYEILSNYDFGSSPTIDDVSELLYNCGVQISELLSDYFLRWESMKSIREDILENLENEYDLIPKSVIRLLVIQFIKEYFNSEKFKQSLVISDFIEIEDVGY